MGAREEMHSNLLHWRVPPSTTALLALGWATYFPWDSWEVFWKLWSSEVSIRIFSLSRAYTEQEIAAYLQKQIMKDSKLSATVTVPTVTVCTLLYAFNRLGRIFLRRMLRYN